MPKKRLRHDLAYLKEVIRASIQLGGHPYLSRELGMLEDLIDYFIYLTLDALDDIALAEVLVNHFAELRIWLAARVFTGPSWLSRGDQGLLVYYDAWLSTFERLLCLRHEVDFISRDKLSLEEFHKRWAETSKKLGL